MALGPPHSHPASNPDASRREPGTPDGAAPPPGPPPGMGEPILPGAPPPRVLVIPRRLRFRPRRRKKPDPPGRVPRRPSAEHPADPARWLRTRVAALPGIWREALHRAGLAAREQPEARGSAAGVPGGEPTAGGSGFGGTAPDEAGRDPDVPETGTEATQVWQAPRPARPRGPAERWAARRAAARAFDRWSRAGRRRRERHALLDVLGDWGTVALAVALVLVIGAVVWRPGDVPTLGPRAPGGGWPEFALPAGPGGVNPLAGRIIAIDPGHGGADSGATHASYGWSEKDLALDIARRLARILAAQGASAVLTRKGDDDLPERGYSNARTLRYRLDVARGGGAELFVSLHLNSFPVSRYDGAQTFYHPLNPGGEQLARLLQEELRKLQPGNEREVKAEDFFLLRNAEVPAAIVEVGFITSPKDRELLASEAYRDAVARALTVALARFWATVPNATGR